MNFLTGFKCKIKNAVSGLKFKTSMFATMALTLGLSAFAFAAEGDTVVGGGSDGFQASLDVMKTAYQTIQADFLSVVGVVAPISIAIAGVFIVWRYGFRFFKATSKP